MCPFLGCPQAIQQRPILFLKGSNFYYKLPIECVKFKNSGYKLKLLKKLLMIYV
jgi:hypothetical protein